MEADRAADRRHAERIAVAADSGHDAGDEMSCLWMVRRTEAQEVETGDGAGAHGEDIAQNATDPGRGALVRLDERWVVVAFHLEDAGLAVADVDDARVLAGSLDDPGSLGRQAAQMQAGGFVRAMLVPHRRDDAKFGERGGSADQGDEALIFVGLQTVGDRERFVDLRLMNARRCVFRWLVHPAP